ncbi:MAG: hypothetical protein CVV04_12015 [Firmicutes bacterium HGW-Firmicutes-9]|jgi:beta-glucanase (GH16 family)|nr:MAG: hypothetical protein CVV04_12015 [Firmicutes bacterium HGW-Firmicutes-9]
MLPTINQALEALDTVLKSLPGMSEKVDHIEAFEQEENYIVWQEDGQAGDTDEADNAAIRQTITGTVDYYTKTEFDTMVSAIQKAMTDGKISWELNSIQHETDTGYSHYEWTFELEVDPHG